MLLWNLQQLSEGCFLRVGCGVVSWHYVNLQVILGVVTLRLSLSLLTNFIICDIMVTLIQPIHSYRTVFLSML